MTKWTKIEFNDNRMDNLRKEGTDSTIYLELPNNVFRIHTEVIEDGIEKHFYTNVNIGEITEL